MSAPSRSPEVTPEEARGVFDGLEDPGAPLTTDEIADELGCARQTADRTLEELSNQGSLRSRVIEAGGRIWWRPATIPEAETGDAKSPNVVGGDRSGSQPFAEFVRAVQDYAIFTLDPDGRVATWNEGAQRIKGYDRDEIVGEHFSTFYTAADRDRAVSERLLETAAEQGRIEDEGWRVRADGSEFWANVVITAIRDEDGTLRGFTKVTRDMTERRERETQLEDERELLDRILEASPIGIAALTPDGEIIQLNDHAAEIVGTDPDEIAGGEYRGPEWDVYDASGAPIPPEDRAFGRVVETGEPVTDLETQVERPDESRVWLSVNGVPVTDSSGELSLIVLTYEDITDRKEYERQLEHQREELERERSLLDQILETVPVGIATFSQSGEVARANPRAGDILSINSGSAEGQQAEERIIYDADGNRLSPEERPFTRIFETGEPVSDWQCQIEGPEGERRWVAVNIAPLRPESGEIEQVVAAGEDITELKTQAERLAQRREELEAELDEVFARIDDAFYGVDDQFRFTYVNERAEQLLQHDENALIGRSVWDVFPEAAETAAWDAFHRALETQGPTNYEVYFEPLGFWVEANVYPSESGLSVYFQDVTERVEREQELKRFRTIVETVDDGVYTVDTDGRFTMVNETYARMTGYSREDLMGEHVSMVVNEDTVETARDFEHDMKSGEREAVKYEADILTADGGSVRAEATFSLLPSDQDEYERVGVVRDVTDRVERERELEQYERIIQTVDDGIYVLDGDHEFTLVNDAFVAMTGRSRDELVGAHGSIVFGETFDDAHEETAGDLEDGRLDVANVEETVHTESGESVPVESRFVLFDLDETESGRVGVVRDITDRKEHERELRRYETLIEESTDVNVVVDHEGTIEYVTPSATYVLGYEPRELVGKDAFEYIHPADREAALEAFDALRQNVGERSTTEFRFHHADGSWVWLEARGRNLEDDPTIGNIVVYTRDVTDRKEYEERLSETVEKLEASNERLEQFAYVASHDLQEPLRMISNYLGLLEDRYRDALDEDAVEFIDFAVDGAERMREMIDALLAYSRVDSQAEPPTPTDSEVVVERVLDQLQMQIEESGADVTVESLPTVLADENQLEQVFQNFVSNAIKYNGNGQPRVEIGAERRNDRWQFRVKDDGIGIDPDHADQIFDVFKRLHTREEYPGTGIGLALCKRIVERHGGRIWVESEVGEGSTFYFTIPAIEDHHE